MKNIDFVFWTFLAIAVLGMVVHFDDSSETVTDSFLSSTDSVSVSSIESRAQLRSLVAVIVQHQTNWSQFNAVRDDLRMQTRSFYAVIFAGLLSAALIAERRKRAISNVALIVAVLMYALDVHSLDITKRFDLVGLKLHNTLQQLMHVPPDDIRWHTLDFPIDPTKGDLSWIERFKQDTLPRLWGKVKRAFTPSFEQVGFYFVPILLLLGTRKKLGI